MKKRGQILVENLIFIILNLVFLAIMVLFIAKQGAGATILEQTYAKQIALAIDAAEPGATIKINMYDAKEISDEKRVAFDQVVKINRNFVKVKLAPNGGYEYSFFNDVEATPYPDDIFYIITIDKKIMSAP